MMDIIDKDLIATLRAMADARRMDPSSAKLVETLYLAADRLLCLNAAFSQMDVLKKSHERLIELRQRETLID